MTADIPSFPESERWRVYERQEIMTPGVLETLEILDRWCPPPAGGRVLEVAYGKAEAACRLAARYGCEVVGVDRHDWAAYGRWKAAVRGLGAHVRLLRGDGKALPLREGAFELALCTGGPSIAGEGSIAEMHRALAPGGYVVASDLVWRSRPVPASAVPDWHRPEMGFIALDEFAAKFREAGFEVQLAQLLPVHVWSDYYGPIREAGLEREEPDMFERSAREYWGYAVFIGRKGGWQTITA